MKEKQSKGQNGLHVSATQAKVMRTQENKTQKHKKKTKMMPIPCPHTHTIIKQRIQKWDPTSNKSHHTA